MLPSEAVFGGLTRVLPWPCQNESVIVKDLPSGKTSIGIEKGGKVELTPTSISDAILPPHDDNAAIPQPALLILLITLILLLTILTSSQVQDPALLPVSTKKIHAWTIH